MDFYDRKLKAIKQIRILKQQGVDNTTIARVILETIGFSKKFTLGYLEELEEEQKAKK